MHNCHDIYIQAVKSNKKIILTYFSGQMSFYPTKLCVPVHYSPPDSSGGSDYYYFWDEEADTGERMLALPTSQIKFMELSNEAYNPADYVTSGSN